MSVLTRASASLTRSNYATFIIRVAARIVVITAREDDRITSRTSKCSAGVAHERDRTSRSRNNRSVLGVKRVIPKAIPRAVPIAAGKSSISAYTFIPER